MNHKYYSTNGATSDTINSYCKQFYIKEYEKDDNTLDYCYNGYDIYYNLDDECIELYDLFQNNIFSSTDDFYYYLSMLPIGITEGGLNSDCAISKENFEKYFCNHIRNLYKFSSDFVCEYNSYINKMDNLKYYYAYLADCQSLINTLQELILSSKNSFVYFYKYLSEVPIMFNFKEIYFSITNEGRLVFNMASNLIITLYSIFDILTKICYELEHIKDCSENYPKLSSSKILYGDKKRLRNLDFKNTIFEENKDLNMIISLRHELIHNATWEMAPKIFIDVKDKKNVKKFIFMPDFDENGHLIKYKNRNRFFNSEKKLNEELPVLYMSILNLIYHTIKKINSTYVKKLS